MELFERPRSMTKGKDTVKKGLLTLLTLALVSSPVWAHEYWLKPEGDKVILLYGHPEENETYTPDVLRSVKAHTGEGKETTVSQELVNGLWNLQAEGAEIWTAEVDNGYWSKTADGWKHSPRSQEKDVVKATKDQHFAKLVGASSLTHVADLPLEIVLESVSAEKVEGRVLLRGKPVAGVKIEEDEEKIGQTDENGHFSVTPKESGTVMLRAHYQEPLAGDSEADFLNLDATVTFPR